MENIDFISIYRKYRSRAVNVANTVLKDKDEAEDVCQETFEILYKLGDKVDFYDEEKLAYFISRICRFSIIRVGTRFYLHKYILFIIFCYNIYLSY